MSHHPQIADPNTKLAITHSKEAIKYFAGRIPVLGVCMGESVKPYNLFSTIEIDYVTRQCMYSVFGGHVEVTGEILHGKTSPLAHDSKGLFAGLPQDLKVTRYHSLAGTHLSLPPCLEVSSWIAHGPDGDKGIIMGVRHKELLVEGVQFHPESILTENGRAMLKNFLRMKGGTWKENETVQRADSTDKEAPMTNGTSHINDHNQKQDSILDRIFAHRRKLVEAQKQEPSLRPSDLQAAYHLNLSPPQISFPKRLRISPYSLPLMAEVKRASPSKGDIALEICAPAQARKYALAGASVISVLTEPKWFKGSVHDLRAVRQSLEGMPNRPALLAKEFIFDQYQILEARLAGADTVLLIVKMLDEVTLRTLYCYSQSLGMEPLVEVQNSSEMDIALSLGAQVIGVNNRNLANFEVDLETTSRLMGKVPRETIVCALSGISGPKDVDAYRKNGVGAVLVGEALMRAENPLGFADDLLGRSQKSILELQKPTILVKICGTRTPAAADAAINAGADLIGIILVQGRKRCVSPATAVAISEVVHRCKGSRGPAESNKRTEAVEFFEHTTSFFQRDDRAMLVGVFQNQPLAYILAQQKLLDLDVVQLHGSEPIEWASLIPVPVIRRFGPQDPGLGKTGYHSLPLLDSASGGTGERLDLAPIKSVLGSDPNLRVVLAGGLDPDNVGSILFDLSKYASQIAAVDVSSGVEQDGAQDLDKIRTFISAAKAAVQG